MTTRVEEIAARLEACKGKPNESRAYAAFIGGVDGPSMDGSDGDVAYLLAEVKRLEAERDAALRAVSGLIRWANSDGADGGYPPVELTPAVIEAARKMGD